MASLPAAAFVGHDPQGEFTPAAAARKVLDCDNDRLTCDRLALGRRGEGDRPGRAVAFAGGYHEQPPSRNAHAVAVDQVDGDRLVAVYRATVEDQGHRSGRSLDDMLETDRSHRIPAF